MEVVAMRDIAAGEEIVQSYVPLGLFYDERRQSLNSWGFTCTCDLCTSRPEQRIASDERRASLLQIYGDLTKGDDLDSESIEELVEEMMALVHEERLEPQLLVYYEAIARAYMGVGDLESARKIVILCEELWVQYGGAEHDNVAGIRQLWKDLEHLQVHD